MIRGSRVPSFRIGGHGRFGGLRTDDADVGQQWLQAISSSKQAAYSPPSPLRRGGLLMLCCDLACRSLGVIFGDLLVELVSFSRLRRLVEIGQGRVEQRSWAR